MTLPVALGLLSLAIWIYLLRWRDGFWRADQWLPPNPSRSVGEPWPGVVAIVPARNEVGTIARCLQGLVDQDYPGALSVILVDDASDDGTGEAARIVLDAHGERRSGLVIEAPPLAEGWTGKLAAMETGVRAAETFAPEAAFVWFTDADIAHDPRTLSRLVAKAREGRDLVSLMVRLHCSSAWERLLIPAFVFFFQMLYPFPAINAAPSRVGGAAGGCVLLRRASLSSIGGLAAIRGALIDDCSLAEAVRARGGRLWLGLADSSRSLRPYAELKEIWDMVARTAYAQLSYSPLLLLGTIIGLVLVFLVPPLLLLTVPFHKSLLAFGLGAAAWVLMAKAYLPTLRVYHGTRLRAFGLPASATLYMAMTVSSALRHWRGAGGQWKARTYKAPGEGGGDIFASPGDDHLG